MTLQRFGPLTTLALLVFFVGFLLGLQLAPLNQTMALGLGGGAVGAGRGGLSGGGMATITVPDLPPGPPRSILLT